MLTIDECDKCIQMLWKAVDFSFLAKRRADLLGNLAQTARQWFCLKRQTQRATCNWPPGGFQISFPDRPCKYMDENSSGVETHSITCQEQRLLNYDEAHNVAQEPTVRQDTRFSAAINVSWTSESSASSFEVCASFASTSLHSRLKSFVVLHGSFMRARQE